MRSNRIDCVTMAALFLAAVGCGGSSDSPVPAPTPAPAPAPSLPLPPLVTDPETRLSADTPFAPGCSRVAQSSGTEYRNAEVEPHVAINPLNPANLIAAWQQDRWSSGGASGTVGAVSFDSGASWTRMQATFSRCGGGTVANGGDYERATDPWVAFAADGTAYQMALAFSGSALEPGSSNAMLVARSTDGGRTWGAPSTLIASGSTLFNDKNTLTADPTNANFVYAVWDRLTTTGMGPALFARTTTGGTAWEAAQVIYDSGANSQTIGNLIVVLPNGTLLNFFTQINIVGNTQSATLNLIRSTDRGATWSGPVRVSDMQPVGARDPATGIAIRDGAVLAQAAVAPNGNVYAVWQDSRFSGGAIDGIALSRSTDGGATWSAPAQINSAPSVPAFTPQVHVRSDGVVGVTYFDLRSNTVDPATLPTESILARSSDNGATWRENRLTPTFDLANAPQAGGLFIGDYMGIVSQGTVFMPVYVRTNPGIANRTDVYAVVARSALSAAGPVLAVEFQAARSEPLSPDARQRTHEAIVRVLERRRSEALTRAGVPPTLSP